MTSDMTCTSTYSEPSLKNESAAITAGISQINRCPPEMRKAARETQAARRF
jgi:hypothetical protein